MRKDLEATGIGIVVGTMVFFAANAAMGRGIFRTEREHEEIVVPVHDTDPESLYAANCQMCHQPTGLGLPGAFPPLVGSEWVVEDPESAVRVMLLGIGGEIEVGGTTFNGVMPAQAHLDDEQIALLATKLRTSWENGADEVTTEFVAEVRASLSGRTTPLEGGAELQALRDAE